MGAKNCNGIISCGLDYILERLLYFHNLVIDHGGLVMFSLHSTVTPFSKGLLSS